MPESEQQFDQQGREVVRVRDKDTGHKYTEIKSVVDANPDAYQVLKQEAVDHNGWVLPPEHYESPGTSGQKATTSKESN